MGQGGMRGGRGMMMKGFGPPGRGRGRGRDGAMNGLGPGLMRYLPRDGTCMVSFIDDMSCYMVLEIFCWYF